MTAAVPTDRGRPWRRRASARADAEPDLSDRAPSVRRAATRRAGGAGTSTAVPPVPPAPPGPAGGAGVAWSLVGLAIVVGAWQLASMSSPTCRRRARRSPSCASCWPTRSTTTGPNDKGIVLRLGESLQRVFTGFAMAALVGIPFGLLLGASRRAWQAFNPVVQLLRPVSPLAWFPIWLIVLADRRKAAAVGHLHHRPVADRAEHGGGCGRRCPRTTATSPGCSGSGGWPTCATCSSPTRCPSIVTGLRVSMGIAWMVIVAVEMLAGGVGHRLLRVGPVQRPQPRPRDLPPSSSSASSA